MRMATSRPTSGRERKGKFVSERRGKTSSEDRTEGATDKAKGRLKEAAGAVTGNERMKEEGKADQRGGTVKEKKGKLKNLFE